MKVTNIALGGNLQHLLLQGFLKLLLASATVSPVDIYRRVNYREKTSVELIALLVISCIFFLFCMHTNKLNSRLKEMEMKLHPSEFSALGLTGDGVGVEVGGSSSGSNSNHLDSSTNKL
ncbi:hypothetical protein GQX74_012767 [Glossina fuscipes]|nr:hypothetical protein GQX74_012767 [Glossina fuscipes]